MSDDQTPPSPEGQRPPTEEELRAAYEAELKRLRVEDVVAQDVVSLLNLGARRAGLVPGAEDERDLGQARLAIDGVRALLPLIEPVLGPNARPLRDALAQLQVAYARLAGGEPGAEGPPGGEGGPGEPPPAPEGDRGPGPAESSGRLWVPGQ